MNCHCQIDSLSKSNELFIIQPKQMCVTQNVLMKLEPYLRQFFIIRYIHTDINASSINSTW